LTRRYADVAVGEELPPLGRVVTLEDVAAYAEVSGDRNPLHLDDDHARRVGFPGIIAHGMFTMGHLASCVSAWVGEPGGVRRISAQFRAYVLMGETIVAGGRVRDLDPATLRATLELWVRCEREGQTEWPIRRGEAEVQLA